MDYDTRHSASVVTADDGRALSVSTFEPTGDPRGVALVVPAMATPAGFYASFAGRLADHGVRAVTFDYRGMEDRAALRGETGDVDRWIADAANVLSSIADDAAGLPLTWVGHSLGGQIVPFVEHTRLASVITIAAGDGYWRRNAPGIRWRVPFLWWVAAPLAIRLTGHFPGNRLGMVGDLPANVMRQWRRWCLHPEYLQADHPAAPALFAEVKAPLMSLSFTDDELMSADSIQHLHDWYTGTEQVRQRYSPEQLDGRRVGHHGFFRSTNADLWDELVLPWVATTPPS
jgi:predicted alpha/beta hydrolase